MSEVLLDTNVIIYYLAGFEPYRTIVIDLITQRKAVFSVISVAEVIAKLDKEDKNKFEQLSSTIDVQPIDLVTAQIAGALRARLIEKQKRSQLLDCLIAASAINHGYLLATSNRKDFPFKELKFAKL